MFFTIHVYNFTNVISDSMATKVTYTNSRLVYFNLIVVTFNDKGMVFFALI